MKKHFLFPFLFLFSFTVQHINARAVLSGESLWAMQRLVTQASCDVTIRQSDLSMGIYTISTSGVYCLAENITGKILINTDNVILDLNGKTVTNTSDNCVEVNGTSNALIKNGSVIAANHNGIAVLSGSNQVTIKDVTSYGSAVGIDATSSTNVYVDGCDLIASNTGMIFDTVSRAQVNNTITSDSVYVGFLLDASSKSLFTNCHALNTGQGLSDLTANIYGFLSTDGSSNIFRECVAQNTLALTVTGELNVAAGFAFSGTESNSKISKCTSNVMQTDSNGFALPYGILLQYSFDTLTKAIGRDLVTATEAIAWSPDGIYLAAGNSNTNAQIYVLLFNRATETLILTDTKSQGTNCNAVSWSPDGAYLATGGASEPPSNKNIQIFSFDQVTGKLTQTDVKSQETETFSIAWSPDGAYLATIGEGTEDAIKIFEFNRSTGTLAQTDGLNAGTSYYSAAWSPDGTYLATGGSGTDEIEIFSFDRLTGTVTKTDGQNQGTACNAVAWTPDGAYLATGGSGSDPEIQIFSFNRSTGTLTPTDGQSQGTECDAVAWSPDGAFLATGGTTQGVNDEIQIFSFDRSTEILTTFTGASQSVQCFDLAWAPDGAYLATVGFAESGDELQIFKAFLFPSRNEITNNEVESASRSSSLAAGVGISGSNIENLIIGNSSYNNGGFNYQFVTNVFDERFTTIPTAVQNISIKLPPFFYAPSP